MVREALADTIRGRQTEEEQVKGIDSRLQLWSSALFGDGQLEQALDKT